MQDAAAILKRHAATIERELQNLLSTFGDAPARLIEAIQYSLLDGGKRLRPALVLESFAACAAEDERENGRRGEGENTFETSSPILPVPRSPPPASALAAACAIELIHTFSLVHDDLPAMDNDDLRRGKPTNHKVYGEAMAILAGDAMVTMAFQIIATKADPATAPRLVAELAAAAGPCGMIGGQVLDIAGENQSLSLDQLQQVHRMKTGALLTASCRLGAIAGRANKAQLDALGRFGQHLGLAFQIVDDVLDVTATSQQLGKATNKDRRRGKNTFPALLGLETSRAEARKHLGLATDALAGFSDAADGLRALARFIVDRQS